MFWPHSPDCAPSQGLEGVRSVRGRPRARARGRVDLEPPRAREPWPRRWSSTTSRRRRTSAASISRASPPLPTCARRHGASRSRSSHRRPKKPRRRNAESAGGDDDAARTTPRTSAEARASRAIGAVNAAGRPDDVAASDGKPRDRRGPRRSAGGAETSPSARGRRGSSRSFDEPRPPADRRRGGARQQPTASRRSPARGARQHQAKAAVVLQAALRWQPRRRGRTAAAADAEAEADTTAATDDPAPRPPLRRRSLSGGCRWAAVL